MDKLTAIKIKYDDETYSDEIPISVLSENVEWDSTHTLVDVLGSVDVDITGTIQDQISQLFNEKVSSSQLQNYVTAANYDGLKKDVVIDRNAFNYAYTLLQTELRDVQKRLSAAETKLAAHYNIELGTASTDGAAFTLPSAGTYLLITGHNSTAGLNGIHIVRTSGNKAFKVAGAANITVTVSGTIVTVKTNGGTANVYAVKLG